MWVAIVLLILYLIFNILSEEQTYKKRYIFDDLLKNNDKISMNIRGEFESSLEGENSDSIILKHVRLYENSSYNFKMLNNAYLPAIIIYVNDIPKDITPGNQINCKAKLMNIKSATNPGEFDLRQYYCEKKIYYMAVCSEGDINIINAKSNVIKTFLFQLRDNIKKVYIKCLPEKEAGTICAMLLGDKSIIDEDVKELYRQNGIGHLLAISGLHVTILCMGLKKLLSKLRVNEKAAIVIIVLFLLFYGLMTGFGVSTSRAVIMMLFALAAQINGRSYDMLSAMSVSAVFIVVQKPYALFSCSFLLSYCAIIAIAVVYPFLEKYVIVNEKLITHKNKEKFFDYVMIEIRKSFLMSFSIQFFTLPVILYFYYETPVYGLILNLIILPLSNLLVIFGAIGGVLGLLILPAGKFFLGIVYVILNIFEKSCTLFNDFPFHIIVTGRPGRCKIFIYYFVIISVILLFNKMEMLLFSNYAIKNELYTYVVNISRKVKHKTIFICLEILLLLVFILTPVRNKNADISFLDIGQGDCIIVKSESGRVYMIDGGSSSKKNIGKYIITPYLKYYGITRIDYCIVTHSDSDHVSGILEILEQKKSDRIQIDNFMIPEPDESLKDETYKKLLQLAKENCKKVSYIKKFDMIQDKNLKIVCIHPERGYYSDSANAYSAVLSITNNSNSILLTGDLEKDGETSVIETLNQHRNLFPKSYTLLKVAHHGSKNSTSDEFLERVNPDISVISCGKKNRYGHPHDELLNRLKKINTTIFRTDMDGAVTLPLVQ